MFRQPLDVILRSRCPQWPGMLSDRISPFLPLLSCDISCDTSLQTHLWNAAAQGLQLSDSVAVRLPRTVTSWPCSLLVSLDPQLFAEFQEHSKESLEERKSLTDPLAVSNGICH